MTVVIADNSPLNYLTLIGSVDVLHQLYGVVVVPQQVISELIDSSAPHDVRTWALKLPAWIDVRETVIADDDMEHLDPGEILAAALYLAMTASAALAHHSHVYFYDQCKSVTIEGRVDSVQFTDPHAKLVIRLDDGTTYTVDWMTPNNLRRNGILEPAEKALAPGARVSVVGAPIRTAAEIRGFFPDFTREVTATTLDATLIRLVDDSFRWARPPQNPELCKDR